MKVSCSVIEDLLPSYLDGLLSDDSRKMVEEHLEECPACRKKLEEMKKPLEISIQTEEKTGEPPVQDARKSARPLRKIKRRLLRRWIIGITAAVLITVSVMRLHSYLYYEKEDYIPYESSEIYLEDNKLMIGRSIAGNRLHDVYSPDQTVEFLYLADTAYSRKEYPAVRQTTMLKDFDNPYDSSVDGASSPGYLDTVTKVYYVSEDAVKQLDTLWKMEDKGESEQDIVSLMQEIERKSILLWEKEDS